jgi:integrase
MSADERRHRSSYLRRLKATPGRTTTTSVHALKSLWRVRWTATRRRLSSCHGSVTRGIVTTPKSGKGREVDLGDEAITALKNARNLKGPLVFCGEDGRMLGKNEVKHPLWRACRKAGLRQIGWHVLRHTYASHLAMRGAPLKAIQELLGHATIEMTMRYAHLSPGARRDSARLLDGLPMQKSGYDDRASTEIGT